MKSYAHIAVNGTITARKGRVEKHLSTFASAPVACKVGTDHPMNASCTTILEENAEGSMHWYILRYGWRVWPYPHDSTANSRYVVLV